MANDLDDLMFGDRRHHKKRHGDRRKQTAAQRRASLRNLAKARRARRHGSAADRRRHKRGGFYGLFGDVFGDARAGGRLKRPYKKSVQRKGRKLVGKHRIGKVAPAARRGAFRSVTRGGTVYEAYVSKKGGGRKGSKKSKRRR